MDSSGLFIIPYNSNINDLQFWRKLIINKNLRNVKFWSNCIITLLCQKEQKGVYFNCDSTHQYKQRIAWFLFFFLIFFYYKSTCIILNSLKFGFNVRKPIFWISCCKVQGPKSATLNHLDCVDRMSISRFCAFGILLK